MTAADSRFSGRLVQSYTVAVPAAPGWAQPARHHHDSAGGEVDRDDAPQGAGWQPAAWTTMPTAVLQGEDFARATSSGHRRAATHDGDEGRGPGVPRVPLDSTDLDRGGDTPAPLWGAGGAANGGLRAEGSAPWMSPAYTRRRADGGFVTRPAGYRLGHRHITVNVDHRQGLHFNRPTLRGVREKIIRVADRRALRDVGPTQPSSRTIIAPYTSPEPGVVVPVVATPIGSEWVQ